MSDELSEVEARANRAYLNLLAAIRAIADDEEETPRRRKIARDALDADARRGPQTSLLAQSSGERHYTSGGMFAHTLAVEEGWDE